MGEKDIKMTLLSAEDASQLLSLEIAEGFGAEDRIHFRFVFLHEKGREHNTYKVQYAL